MENQKIPDTGESMKERNENGHAGNEEVCSGQS